MGQWPTAPERLWLGTNVGREDGCWEWKATAGRNQYGSMRVRESNIGTHVYSWELANGIPAPKGMFVCHSCDNKSCVNPRHLFLDTPRGNTQDMIRKGRRVMPSTENRMRGSAWRAARPTIVTKGENHPQAKITEADVVAIRNSPLTGVAIAEIYEMSSLNVSRIRRRLIWKHVA